MKKLLVLISALAALSFGTAQADISVSGSGKLVGQSIGSDTIVAVGGGIAFAASSTLDNGVSVSVSGLSLSTATDGTAEAAATPTTDADAFHQITFGMGSSSLTVGGDIEIDYAELGVGAVAGDEVSVGLGTASSSLTTGDYQGNGFAFSSVLGSATVSVGYLYDNTDSESKNNFNDSGNEDSAAFKVSLPLGPLSATLGYEADNTASAKANASGASIAYAVPTGGTLSVGYVNNDGASVDATQMSAAYSTSLADGTAVAVGYTSTDAGSNATTTDLEVSVSRSIGAGASIFFDMHTRSGVSSGETSSVAVGSSFAF